MLQGFLASLGAPLGWAALQYIQGVDVIADMASNPLLYGYMTFATAAVFAAFGYFVGNQETRMMELSLRDPLTRLFNRRYFTQRLREETAAGEREGKPLSLIYFDLDHFKRVNDMHGHAMGDLVLTTLAQAIAKVLRENEIFARIGGEEFAVLVPRDGLDHAARLAERILVTSRDKEACMPGGTCITVTLSLGVVEHRAGETPDDFYKRADAAMYRAKEKGRNRVEVEA